MSSIQLPRTLVFLPVSCTFCSSCRDVSASPSAWTYSNSGRRPPEAGRSRCVCPRRCQTSVDLGKENVSSATSKQIATPLPAKSRVMVKTKEKIIQGLRVTSIDRAQFPPKPRYFYLPREGQKCGPVEHENTRRSVLAPFPLLRIQTLRGFFLSTHAATTRSTVTLPDTAKKAHEHRGTGGDQVHDDDRPQSLSGGARIIRRAKVRRMIFVNSQSNQKQTVSRSMLENNFWIRKWFFFLQGQVKFSFVKEG